MLQYIVNGELGNYAAVDEIANMIADIVNQNSDEDDIRVIFQNVNDSKRRSGIRLNNNKLKKLGWSPKISIEEGIRRTLNDLEKAITVGGKKMQFRDLQKQYNVLKEEIDREIEEVCASAQYISGSKVTELEEKLAEYVGVKHCITCANGTDALTLALKAWGIGENDAIFVPDFTFSQVGNVLLVRAQLVYLLM